MDTSKVVISVVLGLVFWFSGALSVKLLGAHLFTAENPYKPLVFLALFPVSYVFILIAVKAASLRRSEILRSVVIMTIAATFCDGLALTYFRELYAAEFEQSHFGAAAILFGAGAGLLVGMLMNRADDSAV